MQDELEALRNEITKKNRDQLDMMYNLDMDNFSDSTKALFKKWSDGSNEAMTYFQTYIKGNEAKWEAYAEWQTSTSKSISTIEGRVTANESNIDILSQWTSDATDSIAAIRQTANSAYSQVESLTSWRGSDGKNITDSLTSIKQTSDSASSRIDLLVETTSTGDSQLNSSAASIIMKAINGDTSSIKIKADKIEISGDTQFITSADLSDTGSTVVSGNRISLMANYGSNDPVSRLLFSMQQPSVGIEKYIGYIKGGDIGSGEENDARIRLTLKTNVVSFDGVNYPTALYLDSAGGISIISGGEPSGIYIESILSYITLNALHNTRIRANKSFLNMGNTGAMSAANTDYVFCTDGIYYNGIKILST